MTINKTKTPFAGSNTDSTNISSTGQEKNETESNSATEIINSLKNYFLIWI